MRTVCLAECQTDRTCSLVKACMYMRSIWRKTKASLYMSGIRYNALFIFTCQVFDEKLRATCIYIPDVRQNARDEGYVYTKCWTKCTYQVKYYKYHLFEPEAKYDMLVFAFAKERGREMMITSFFSFICSCMLINWNTTK